MVRLPCLKMNEPKKIADLPNSDDKEFWEGEVIKLTPKAVDICPTHSRKNYLTHNGYVDKHDGTVMCKFCPWGGLLTGNLRVIDGRLKTIVS